MRVFVTDGDNRAALAVTRSLGRRGHEVIVGEKRTPTLAQSSRYCSHRIVYPDPATDSDAFVDALVETIRRERIDVLIPVSDITTFLITESRDRFDSSCAIPFGDAAVVRRAADKVDLVQTALRIGVPVPRTTVVLDASNVPPLDIDFPLVIKPRQSRVRTPTGWASSAVSFAANERELHEDLAARPAHEFPVMLQERIIGPGVGVFACYHDGRPVALFSHRRLRERPPWGGVSVLSESVPMPPAAQRYATRLLDEIGWHGVAMVEFKHDLRDDEPKLIEINGRFWGSLQLAIDAGVDFPSLLLQGVESGRFEPQEPYRVGVRNRWFWGDMDALLLTLLGSRRGPSLPQASRVRAVLDFLRLWSPNLYYENPKLHDLGPWLYETRGWVFRGGLPSSAPAPRNGHQPEVSGPRESVVAGGDHATPTSQLSAQIVHSLEATGLDRSSWNALALASGTRSVFQTYEWTHAWWTVFGGRYAPVFITVKDGAGKVSGVAPLMMERGPLNRTIRFQGEGRADYCDFLSGDDPQVTAAVVNALLTSDAWDIIELNNVPACSGTTHAIMEACASHGFSAEKEDRSVCPTLLIEGHEAEARAIRDKASLRRRQKYFERAGQLHCFNLTTSVAIEPYLDRFFEQHMVRWRQKGSPSLFRKGSNCTFYRTLTQSLAAAGWLLFSVVEFDGKPIAFHYGFDYDGCVTWYKPSFDVAFAVRSPGLVLVRHLISFAIDAGRRELDFTLGDEPFKKRFTNSARTTVRIRIFRDQSRQRLDHATRSMVAAVRKVSG